MDKKNLLLWIGVFWVIIILIFIGVKEFTLKTGTEVMLKTRPIDPRDLFRGDYVILSYEISTFDINNIPGPQNFINGDTIYIALDIDDEGYAFVSEISKQSFKDKLFIKGKIKRLRNSVATVEYGIESYFVPEGKGRPIESQRGGRIDVKAAVDEFGTVLIKELLIDGEEVKFE